MPSKPAISIRDLSKQYRIGTSNGGRFKYKSLGQTLADTAKRPLTALTANRRLTDDNSFWALKDVSFDVQPGEVVGIIGRNGAGKSTLLKILSQITKPTTGEIEVRGRVGSLLEVGTGFHPELTGRENIYLNGAILGMTHREITSRADEIIEFSELSKFLDTPVKRYSSGMYTRLAFAVAAHLEPEILVVDEVLAVGDAAFQRKCLGKMKDVAGQGRTVVFVSHQMPAVRNLCGTAVHLKNGSLEDVGETDQIVKSYLSDLAVTAAATGNEWEYTVSGLKVINHMIRLWADHDQDDLLIDIALRSDGKSDRLGLSIEITAGDTMVSRLMPAVTGLELRANEGKNYFSVRLPKITSVLPSGNYNITLGIHEMFSRQIAKQIVPTSLCVLGRSPYESKKALESPRDGYVMIPVRTTRITSKEPADASRR